LTKCPAGYDLYYEIDNNGDAVKFGGEKEDDNLPYTLELDNIKNSVVLTMVVDENSDDSGMVVLSETVEITSDIPGKSAYVGYLTDSMCTVSCDANGNPTAGQVYETTFKVTNGTVQNVTLPQGNGYKLTHEGNGKIKIDSFTQALSEVTKLKFTATYVDSEGITGEEEASYTIVKLKIAEASTILDFSNDNVIIPCDENGQPYISEASTFVAMLHGDDVLNLTSTDVTLGDRDKQGYYKISFNVNNLVFNGDVCNKELTFTGKDATGES
jgi:hypothetical protein